VCLSFFEKSLQSLIFQVGKATRLEVDLPKLLVDEPIERLAVIRDDRFNNFWSEVAWRAMSAGLSDQGFNSVFSFHYR
jgi:hypothetical protein